MADDPSQWEEQWDEESQSAYYFCYATNETSWYPACWYAAADAEAAPASAADADAKDGAAVAAVDGAEGKGEAGGEESKAAGDAAGAGADADADAQGKASTEAKEAEEKDTGPPNPRTEWRCRGCSKNNAAPGRLEQKSKTKVRCYFCGAVHDYVPRGRRGAQFREMNCLEEIYAETDGESWNTAKVRAWGVCCCASECAAADVSQ